MRKRNRRSQEASKCQTQMLTKRTRLGERLDNRYLDEQQQLSDRLAQQINDAVIEGASIQDAVSPQNEEAEVTINFKNQKFDDWRGQPKTTAERQDEDRAVNHHTSSILSTLRWSALRWSKQGESIILQRFSECIL